MVKMRFSKIISGFWRAADWNYSVKETEDFINYCIDNGIATFDHADIYGDYTCEEIFGKALANLPSVRSEIQIVTKCGIKLVSEKRPENRFHIYDTSKEHIVKSVEQSLINLKTDYIDVLLIHRPDPLMNPDEITEAFYQLKKSGKVLNFGVSNFLPHQFNLLQSRLDFPLITNQIEFSVMNLKALTDGTLDQCLERKIQPMAWSPLAGGRLFYENSEQAIRLRNKLQEISERKGVEGIDKIALAFISMHPSQMSIVVGTGKKDRIKSAVDSLNIRLTKEEWFEIWTASMGREIP
jgi:predicted oxidoreductase